MTDLSKQQQIKLLDQYFVSTKEAIQILEISNQSFYSLVSREKIERIYKNGVVLYFREDIISRKKNQSLLRQKYRPFEYRHFDNKNNA